MARALLAGIRQEGSRPGYLLKTGTSDMNIMGPAWNCPFWPTAPAIPSLDHTPEEHIEIEEYLATIRVLEAALGKL